MLSIQSIVALMFYAVYAIRQQVEIDILALGGLGGLCDVDNIRAGKFPVAL